MTALANHFIFNYSYKLTLFKTDIQIRPIIFNSASLKRRSVNLFEKETRQEQCFLFISLIMMRKWHAERRYTKRCKKPSRDMSGAFKILMHKWTK